MRNAAAGLHFHEDQAIAVAEDEINLATSGLAEHLWQTTMDKLAVDQPNYASYKRELSREG